MDKFFIEKLEGQGACYFSSINEDGSFFVRFHGHRASVKFLGSVIAIANTFGFTFELDIINSHVTLFFKPKK